MKKGVFLKNAAILTATSLLLRLLGVFFKVWLARCIGSEGIGLYQLVFSFYVLVSTFATGGIGVAVTRLVADELVLGQKSGVKKIMARSLAVTTAIAGGSFLLIELFADFIADSFIGNPDAALSLKILAFSLFFMGVSSCIKGYFIARRKTLPPSTAQIFEQIVRIVCVFFLITCFGDLSLEKACAAVLLGDTIAEAFSCIYLYFFYRTDSSHLRLSGGRASPEGSTLRALFHIAGPITGGRYVNSGLRTVENILVPRQLVLFGMRNDAALSFFGMIKGMALPILFFPSTVLNSLTTLLIPEISGAVATGNRALIARCVSKTLRLTSLIGFLFGVIFFVCGDDLGVIIYNDAEVGRLIKTLAPLVPLMYLDSISDGILKGMDLQLITFRNSVLDSALRIVLIFFLLPIYGSAGFVGIMYFSNLLTCGLNLLRLVRESRVKPRIFKNVFFPALTATAVTLTAGTVFRAINLSGIFFVGAVVITSVILYFILLLISKTLTKEEIQSIIR